MNYDVVIIGAGNGGLSAAAKLAVSGKKVLVLERHNVPGGCGTSFCRGRFEFEVALHQLSQMGTTEKPGPLMELFKEYGIYEEIDWIYIDSLYKVTMPDNSAVSIPSNKEEAISSLIEKFPHEENGIRKYFKTVYDFSDESEKFLAAQAKSSGTEPSLLVKLLTKPVFKKNYPTITNYGLKSTQEVLDEFFTDPKLKASLNVYWCFMGMSPDRFPFSIQARCTALYIDYKPMYLKGGSQVISESLANVIRKNGGEVKYNLGAKEIIVENEKAVAVVDDLGNRHDALYIVSGISPIATYFNLIDQRHHTEEMKKYLKPYKVGISALTCFIALDCPPEEIGFTDSFNLIYTSYDCNEAYKNAYSILPDTDPLITTCYTVDDPSVGPAGTSIITAGVLKYSKPWEELDPQEYYEKKEECASIIIDRLEKLLPGFRDHIEEIEIASPLTHMRYLNHPGGAIYGFEQDLTQSVYFFPRDNQIKNLTFANGWVNICGFGPNYLYGASVANQILKELK